MKKADLTPNMAVEDRYGTEYRVVQIGGWRKSKGLYHYGSTGFAYHGVPVKSHGYRDAGAAGTLCVRRDAIRAAKAEAPESNPIIEGHVIQPSNLFPVGTFAAKRKAEDEQFMAEHNAALFADMALLNKVDDLWGLHARVLLEDAQVYPDTDSPLSTRERDVVRVIIACGERR